MSVDCTLSGKVIDVRPDGDKYTTIVLGVREFQRPAFVTIKNEVLAAAGTPVAGELAEFGVTITARISQAGAPYENVYARSWAPVSAEATKLKSA